MWRFRVTVRDMVYVLAAADVQQPLLLRTDNIRAIMRGHVMSAGVSGIGCFRMVRRNALLLKHCTNMCMKAVMCLQAMLHKATCTCATNSRFVGLHCFTLLLQRQVGQPYWDVLAHETQITHLALELPDDDPSPVLQQLGSLTALRHLDAWGLTEPKPSDCRALERLQWLTTLAIPYGYKVCMQSLLLY